MVDEKGDDPKLLAVVVRDARGTDGPEWTESLRRQVASFFSAYKDHETDAHALVLGWGGAAEARRALTAFTRPSSAFRARERDHAATEPARL